HGGVATLERGTPGPARKSGDPGARALLGEEENPDCNPETSRCKRRLPRAGKHGGSPGKAAARRSARAARAYHGHGYKLRQRIEEERCASHVFPSTGPCWTYSEGIARV